MVTTAPDEFPEGTPSEPEFPLGRRPLHEYLSHHAAEAPDRVAIDYYGTEVTYGDLESAIDSFATSLADRGYGRGDTLLLFLQNCPQYVVAYYAGQRLGMRVSPCSPMARAHRLTYQLTDGEAAIAVAHDTAADLFESVADETPLEDVVYVRFETYLPDEPVPAVHEDMRRAIETERRPESSPSTPASSSDGPTVRYLDSILAETPPEPPEVDLDLDDVCLLQYTSGTTGLPKGCMHTYGNVLFVAASSATLQGLDAETRHLAVMPVFHVAGKLNAVDVPMVRGGTTVLLTRYETEPFVEAIEAHEPTTGWITTPMAREILESPASDEREMTSLETMPVTSFGQSLTEELCDRWERVTGAEMYEAAYGLTETHTRDTFTTGFGVVEEGFVGRPLYETDVVIRDWETHEEVPRGETGEISVKSPSLMEGYLNKPEETAAAFHDGYVLTGDVGRITEEGFLYFLGRRKYVIKSSGYSVAPAEVEEVLKTHPAIDNAAVTGREHERRGEEVVAAVTLADGADPDLADDDLREWAAERLAPYKRPREVTVLESLPVTDVGKLDRERLGDLLS